ncbi:MAG: protein translocase subunit SecF [Oscillospiraceae bacterium]
MKNNKQIDFMAIKKYSFILSIFLILIIAIVTFTKGVDLDIQFKGGSILTYSYEGTLNKETLQKKLTDEMQMSINIQQASDVRTEAKNVIIALPNSLISQEVENINKILNNNFKENNFQNIAISNINPTMDHEFFIKCLVAMGLVLIFMILFIAFRFRKIGGILGGITAVLALIHDVIMIFGAFVLLKFPINDNFIAVVLTIIGYSINDTIVIYDRIRENKELMPKATPIYDLVNLSINQSLKRTVNTTVTTVFSVGVMYAISLCYNITSIQSFALPMIIGMISGIYSTIFIATPLWAVFRSRAQKRLNKKHIAEATK